MDPWPEIHRQRIAVADLLAGLRDDQWAVPSLCAGWTVRDVAGRLTLQQLGLRDLGDMLRHWKGGMSPTIQDAARRRAAAWTPERLVADIRDTAPLRRRNLGVTPMETLIDLLVHSQDIAVPLGIDHPMPPEAAASAARRTLTMRFPPPPPSVRLMAGVRLTATDLPWTFGDGPEARGPIAALLLIITGRSVVLPQLTGPGAELLATRLSP
ncbi:maleylpyruvate isomerase family mycothiol-dependent enzyme [Actinoplanes sichuanensis]|uniref:Maleylpyruvate isomerase family mycothiol-dependent enzyme n=1 Tax=Actinoplanes sichuanensis TaxID=512349 RepID=A0ABW4A595_9ACTN|nr:maleylpyruvate isomerase family mycothiol-dependent enzyme [Actinoplanes sichuanensis]BEL07555.1 maleylpyruvate isomerase family mycothiol-dependent enzyme [Actinoplanes sichuanensis]